MPSGNKKRPDTLELEVLGAHNVDTSDDDKEYGVTDQALPKAQRNHNQLQLEQEKRVSAKPQTSKSAKTKFMSDGADVSLPTTEQQKMHTDHTPTEKTTCRSWFRLRRKPRSGCVEASEPTQQPATCDTETKATTNTACATLAKPETSAIANSTTTIITSLPTSLTIPDVAAVLPRQDSKKQRSHTQTDSLYSLATLAQTAENEPQLPHSAPNVPSAVSSNESDNLPHWSCGSESERRTSENAATLQITQTFRERGSRERTLLTSELAMSTEDEHIGVAPPPLSSFRARLISFLDRLTGGKRDEYKRRRARSTHSTIDGVAAAATSTDLNDDILRSTGGADSKGEPKSLNINADFEQFSTTTTGHGAGDKTKGMRRLSQRRRRRSSYYFSENERRIRANDREFNAQFKYADNFIKTSKYTLLTFLPFNLLEQFQRLANFYFLCLLVLQLIPAISSLTPVTTAIPLIGVLTLTAVKDAYDDIQRHLSDSQVNNRKSKTLRNGQLIDAKWSGVQVGDVIRLENNQFVAADILLLTTSEPNGLCFIETAELDGETNLKCKQCLPEITELGQRHDLLWNFNGEIICERPNNLLNKFEGTLMWRNQRYALDNEKILLRGCVLRNTQWCYGVVIFAGKDTKLMQNSGKTQFKSTGVDRLLNFIIIGIVLFLLSICAFFTLACAIWESLIGQNFQVYLPWETIIPQNVAQGSTVIGLLVFFSYAIVLNTVVPISLYVSVEVIRFAQSFLINWDEEMYYEHTKTHAKARTTTLNEELGQIQYIFSDKTGTLTQNIMTFNKCSINGRTYGDVFDLRTGEVIEVTDKQKYVQNSNSNLNVSSSASKSTPAPTILLHTAEVHPKSTLMVSSPEEGGAADVSIVTTDLTASGMNSAVMPITDATNGHQFNFMSPIDDSAPNPSSSNRRGYHGSDNGGGSATACSANTEAKVSWQRQRSSSQSPTGGMRRQLSTLSDTSDKVMIIGDTTTPMQKALIMSFNHSNKKNNNSTCATPPQIHACTSTFQSPSQAETKLLPLTLVNAITTTITHTLNSPPTQQQLAPPPQTITTQSPIYAQSQITTTTTMHSNSISPLSLALVEEEEEKEQQLANTTTTISTKKKQTTKTKNKTKDASDAFEKNCIPCCTCSNSAQDAPQLNDGSGTKSKLKSNLKSHSKKKSKQTTFVNCTKCTHHAHNKNVRIDISNQSRNSTTTTTTTTTFNTADNAFNSYANSWTSSHQKVHALEPVDFSANPEFEPEFRWYDKTLLDAVRSDEEHAHNFFRLLALCHTVMPEYVEGRLEYQAQSPDESALVSAARNFGFVFRSRTPNSITIEVMGNREEYELLNILDFNNVRKRMSVILRRGDDIFLYCKGADNVIYDRLNTSQNDIKARTQDHLNKFAGEGLRTLVLAERHLDETYYMEWLQRQQIAAISLDSREEKLSAMYEEIESELILVGVTAIEDKLQDGVPQTIANLQMAGLKIWVLTGDKQETAINIGYSCQLLTDELADVFIVDGSSVEEVDKQLRQFRESVRIVNRFRPTPLEPNVNLNLNLNGATSTDHNNTSVMYGTGFRTQVSPPPAPAISVVTFRWDDDKIKHNKGEPDSAECNELYDNIEKGVDGATTLHPDELIDESSGFAIVVNGHSLVYCLSPELEARFLDIASQCKAVICCRVTPLQKALVVELIKRAKNAVTLAIGDGANDVSMIKAAHIGVGISGQEGLQAVLASDYSIAQFRYLERLLLVHGRWSYYRMCKFLRYFFYKNFAFTLCHCWYSFFCGFSAQTVFDPMFISVYNLFYTSLPVLALGVFEQDVSDKHSIEYPKLYTPGLRSQLFNTREFVYSVLHGAFSSLILFLIPYGTYKDGVSPNGLILSDHMTLGAVVATILIIDNTAQIALYTSYWTICNHITIWGSLVCFFVLDYFYNYVFGGPYVGSLAMAMKDLTFWTTMVITVIVIMVPVLAYKFYLIDVHPSLTDKIRLKCRVSIRSRQRQSNLVMRTPSARKARRSLRSGYAFAHQEGFGRLITSGKIMRKLPQEFAFPLGLGSKKLQPQSSEGSEGRNNQNNNNSTRSNKNSSTGYLNDIDSESVDGGGGGGGSNGNRSDKTISPRAPCQDLDTINL